MPRLAALACLGACCAGCASTAATPVARAPAFDPAHQTKCMVARSQARPLIVEWPSSERAALESLAKRGPVAVRYDGCEMELLPRCVAPGRYTYSPTTRKSDRVTIRDEDELYSRLPLGAASLEAKLAASGQLDVAMTIVGRFEADSVPRPSDLRGDGCERASHIVTAVAVGAFDFFAGGDATVGGGAAFGPAAAGARGSARHESLATDGDERACGIASSGDARPPEGCGAFIGLEVAPLTSGSSECPPGTAWNGAGCTPVAATQAGAGPAGASGQSRGDGARPPAFPAAVAPGAVPPAGPDLLTPALARLAVDVGAGAQPESNAFSGTVQEGETLEQAITFRPGRCYTVVGASTVQHLDLQIVVQQPPFPPAVVAQSSTQGPQAVLGGKSACWKNLSPIPIPGKVIVKATRGAGMAAAQVYSK